MSVRGERVVYREREEDAPRRTYTTVKRYQVPESARSAYRGGGDGENVKEDKIIIRRERREEPQPPAREEVEYRVSEREREREPRRDISYRVLERDGDSDRRSGVGSRSEFRVVEREREVVRAPSPPSPERERIREYRFERERDFSPPRRTTTITRDREEPFDIEKYTRSTEYYQQPQPIIIRESAPAPQPIIIREERRDPAPIIIREERREPQYEFVEREEVREESRSLVKRDEPPAPTTVASARSPSEKPPPPTQPQEEDYFYERRIREVDRSRRRDDSYERRSEIRPRDSASQYSSDDSYEYVRRERTYEGDRADRARSGSPRHRLHLAEGAAAGIGAAEIIRHHRRSQGQATGHRGRDLIGGAALGAVGAEALSRVRSKSRRRKSRSRSSSYEDRRDRRDRRKHRSRSRSKSLSRAQQLGGLAAVAAVGALAGYALKNRGNKETVVIPNAPPPRRSRSRRRRASVDSYDTYGSAPVDVRNTPQDPEHRNRTMAKAGLATAAAAGIWDRYRSKSRGGTGRSRSRVRQGVPIAAAGLGGAALAGLYEKNKASQQAKKEAIIADEMGRGRRRRSRSRSRSVPAPYAGDDRRSFDDRPMIAYGDEPIYPESARGYYSDEEPGMYRRRHGGSSSGSSPDNRRRRSRSRSRNLAGVGAAAGAAAVAAHQVGKRRERSRRRDESRSRSRSRSRNRRDDDAAYNDQYGRDDVYSPSPMGGPSGYLPPNQGNEQAYPSSNYFPPPPTGEEYARERPVTDQQGYAAYNPADYAQGANHDHHQQQQPYHQSYGGYGDSDANLGAPYPNDTFAGDPRYAAPTPAYEGRPGRDPENVSTPNDASAATRESQDADGVGARPRSPRSRSQSRVRFDLGSNTLHSPEAPRKAKEDRHSDSEASGDKKHRRRQRRKRRDGSEERHRDSPQLMHDKYEHSPEEEDSEGTVELPARFDEQGNRTDGDPLAEKINDLLGGAGFGNILGRVLGGENDDDGGRSGRRRHRR